MPLNNCWGSYFGYYLQVETSVVGNLSNTESYAQQRVTLNEFRNMLQYIALPQAARLKRGVSLRDSSFWHLIFQKERDLVIKRSFAAVNGKMVSRKD